MTHLRRSPVLILALTMLAACSSADTSSATPAASSAAPAATAAALVRGKFAGDAGDLAGIALSTNGRQVIGYQGDGTGRHVSLAQWFMGPVTGTGITNAHGAHLAATVTAQAITGTVTLKDGRSAASAYLTPRGMCGRRLHRVAADIHAGLTRLHGDGTEIDDIAGRA